MLYQITHVSRYKYDSQITHCYNVAHVLPRNTNTQNCSHSHIQVSPTPTSLFKRKDYFGNEVCHFSIQKEHLQLEVTATSQVKVTEPEPLDASRHLTCGKVLLEMKNRTLLDTLSATEFGVDSPMIKHMPALREYARVSFPPDRPFIEAVTELNDRIYQDFKYDPESTEVATPLEEVIENRHGVCQDFAHVGIACMRSMGFAARYVSGYIETLPPPGQEKMVGCDASHAWFAVYMPGAGWFDFDPTNSKAGGFQHITTAWGRDFSDVSPLKGIVFGGGSKQLLEISVDVARHEEAC